MSYRLSISHTTLGMALAVVAVSWRPHNAYTAVCQLFIVGLCGAIGTSDLLACFAAGCALNWDGRFLAESVRRHDEVNSSVDVILNLGGFMYIGTVLPWHEFHNPYVTTTISTSPPSVIALAATASGYSQMTTAFDTLSPALSTATATTAMTTTAATPIIMTAAITTGSGIIYPRLLAMATLVLLLRRIPALLLMYRAMPRAVRSWREALFMGYFGPIGVGAVYYLQSTRHVYFDPELESDDEASRKLLEALSPSTCSISVASFLLLAHSVLLEKFHQ